MPPLKLPPNARLLTDRELVALPAGLRPPRPAGAWGVEFNRRQWGAILRNLALALLYGLPLGVIARLGLHYQGAGPGWLYVLGGLAAVFCLLNLIGQLKSAAVSLMWRSRLIFSPGRLAWQRLPALGRAGRVFDLAEISGLDVVRQGGGPPDTLVLRLKYRRADGSEAEETLLQAPGRTGACLWAADRVLDAAHPRTVPFRQN